MLTDKQALFLRVGLTVSIVLFYAWIIDMTWPRTQTFDQNDANAFLVLLILGFWVPLVMIAPIVYLWWTALTDNEVRAHVQRQIQTKKDDLNRLRKSLED